MSPAVVLKLGDFLVGQAALVSQGFGPHWSLQLSFDIRANGIVMDLSPRGQDWNSTCITRRRGRGWERGTGDGHSCTLSAVTLRTDCTRMANGMSAACIHVVNVQAKSHSHELTLASASSPVCFLHPSLGIYEKWVQKLGLRRRILCIESFFFWGLRQEVT